MVPFCLSLEDNLAFFFSFPIVFVPETIAARIPKVRRGWESHRIFKLLPNTLNDEFWTRKDRKKNKPPSAPQPQSTYATHSTGCVHKYISVEISHKWADNTLSPTVHHPASTHSLFGLWQIYGETNTNSANYFWTLSTGSLFCQSKCNSSALWPLKTYSFQLKMCLSTFSPTK